MISPVIAPYSLRIRNPQSPPLDLIEDLRSALPQFTISTSRDWVEVAGGDFNTIRQRVASVLSEWDAKGVRWQDHLVRL